MKEKQIKNVVIYTRVSTEEQTTGFSLQNQMDSLTSYASAYNYNIVGTYTDAGISGTSVEKRIQYQEMIEHIHNNKGKVDAILIWKLSRIGRKLKDLAELIDFL